MLTTLTGENYPLTILDDETDTSLKKQISNITGVKPIHQELILLEADHHYLLIQKVPDPITLTIYLLDGSEIILRDFDRSESYDTLLTVICMEYRIHYGYILDVYRLHLYHPEKLKITQTSQLVQGDPLYLVLETI